MGASGSETGIQDRVPVPAPTVPITSDSLAGQCSKGGCSVPGDQGPVIEGGDCRGAPSAVREGFYSIIFLVQKVTGVQVSVGSKDSELLRESGSIQNGDIAADYSFGLQGSFHGDNRLAGCILSYPNPSCSSAVSEVLCQGAALPVSGVAFRSPLSSSGAHENG